jgi:hypothetical protein
MDGAAAQDDEGANQVLCYTKRRKTWEYNLDEFRV